MDQAEALNKHTGESNHTLDNMRKIYGGIEEKIKNDGKGLTSPDCYLLSEAMAITRESLKKQLRVVEKSILAYESLFNIYREAYEVEESEISEVLGRDYFFGDDPEPEEDIETEK